MDNIAELSGWTPNEIAENLGMCYQWVMKHLSDKYKEKSWNRETTEPILQRGIEQENVNNEPEESESHEESSMFASFTEFINFLLLNVF